jgi:hypothetical protein
MRPLSIGTLAANTTGEGAVTPPTPSWAFSEDFDSFSSGQRVDTAYLVGSLEGKVRIANTSPYVGQKWYTMRDSGTRFLEFKQTITGTASVDFSVLWNGSSGTWDSGGLSLESTDSTENLVLQYTLNDGASWVTWATLVAGGQRPGGVQQTDVSETISFPSFRLRIVQTDHSGTAYDHYAVKNIVVSAA